MQTDGDIDILWEAIVRFLEDRYHTLDLGLSFNVIKHALWSIIAQRLRSVINVARKRHVFLYIPGP